MVLNSILNTSRPIIFTLENTDLVLDKSATLFLSSVNRGLPNNGFDPAINVTFDLPPYTYTQLLADSENKPFRIWKIRIDQLFPVIPPNTTYPPPPPPPPNSQLNQTLFVTKKQSDGTLVDYPLIPYQDLDQVLWSAIEFRYPVIIDSDYGITFKLLSQHKLKFSIWIDRNTSGSNVLLTGNHEKVFIKPMPIEEKAPYVVQVESPYGNIVYDNNNMSFRPSKGSK